MKRGECKSGSAGRNKAAGPIATARRWTDEPLACAAHAAARWLGTGVATVQTRGGRELGRGLFATRSRMASASLDALLARKLWRTGGEQKYRRGYSAVVFALGAFCARPIFPTKRCGVLGQGVSLLWAATLAG